MREFEEKVGARGCILSSAGGGSRRVEFFYLFFWGGGGEKGLIGVVVLGLSWFKERHVVCSRNHRKRIKDEKRNVRTENVKTSLSSELRARFLGTAVTQYDMTRNHQFSFPALFLS